MKLRSVWTVGLICLASVTARGQALPKFEAASIKAVDMNQRAFAVDLRVRGTRLTITNLTLKEMIRWAWDMRLDQMTGTLPGWTETKRYSIDAVAAEASPQDQFRLRLRDLLAERFGLVAHNGVREGTVYALVAGKGGFKGKASASENSYLRLNRNTPPELPGVSYTIQAQKVTIGRLAEHLSGTLQAPVTDRTGVAGEFDFELPYAIDGADGGPSIFTSVQDVLGLRLEASKGSVPILVVERAVEPTEN